MASSISVLQATSLPTFVKSNSRPYILQHSPRPKQFLIYRSVPALIRETGLPPGAVDIPMDKLDILCYDLQQQLMKVGGVYPLQVVWALTAD